jgi:hypothetical protein
MFSTAVAGSVSDSTKSGTPSFTVQSMRLTPINNQGAVVTPGVQTLTNGQTTAAIAMSDIGFGGSIRFQMQVNIGNSVGGGGRSTSNDITLNPKGHELYSGELQPTVSQTDYDGSPGKHVGIMLEEGPDGSGGTSFLSAIISKDSGGAGGTSNAVLTFNSSPPNLLMEQVEELALGIISSATGLFEIPDLCIEILDKNTGIYALGPSDAMRFTIELAT